MTARCILQRFAPLRSFHWRRIAAKEDQAHLFSRIDERHVPKIGLLAQPRARPDEPPLMERIDDTTYFLIHEREAPPLPNAALPPILPRHEEQFEHSLKPRYHLTDAQFAEMAALRNSDPEKWTVSALARKYKCSPLVVSKYAPCPAPQKERLDAAWQRRWSDSGAVYKAKILRRELMREREGVKGSPLITKEARAVRKG